MGLLPKVKAVMSAYHLFEQIGKDLSGSISNEELKSYLQGQSFRKNKVCIQEEDQINAVFSTIDTDESCVVNFGELLEFVDPIGGLNFGVDKQTYTKQDLHNYLHGLPSCKTKEMSEKYFD